MKCNKCNHENNNNAKFCNECGAKLYENIEESHKVIEEAIISSTTEENSKVIEIKENNKKNYISKIKNMHMNKRYVIISLIIIGTIILAIFIGVNIYYSSKVKQADESMKQKDYGTAVTLYSQALNIFNKPDIQSKLSKANDLLKSKVSYDLGIDKLQNKEYYLAYIDFKDVIEDDIDNYDDSIKKQEESKNLYIADKITEAKKDASDNKYDIAITCLNSALNLDPQNSDVLNLRSQYDSLKKETDAKASADAKAKAEKAKQADIAKRKSEGVRIGMTKDEVLASSWGKPKSINKTTGSYGTHEQWVYGGNNYLYFDNGTLTSIQN